MPDGFKPKSSRKRKLKLKKVPYKKPKTFTMSLPSEGNMRELDSKVKAENRTLKRRKIRAAMQSNAE